MKPLTHEEIIKLGYEAMNTDHGIDLDGFVIQLRASKIFKKATSIDTAAMYGFYFGVRAMEAKINEGK